MAKKKSGPYPASRLAGLKPFKKGESSPNPGGRPRQHREMVMKLREDADFFREAMVDMVERAARGEQLTQSDKILSNHLEFIWKAMFGNHAQAVLFGGEISMGGGESALLASARYDKENAGMTALLLRARAENARVKAGLSEDDGGSALPTLTAAAATAASTKNHLTTNERENHVGNSQ